MSEKITIRTAVEKAFGDKKIYNITLEDGRVGSSYDEKFMEYIGKEVEAEVKDSGKPYKGIPQYYFNLPKTENAKGKFPAKDYTFEKRKVALEQTVSLIVSGKIDVKQLEACRDKFYAYLIQK